MPVQQQSNMIDCGLFAIAIATDLLYGNSPLNVSYEHEKCLSVYKIVYLFTRFVHIISKSNCRSLQDKKFYVQFRCLFYFPGCLFWRRYRKGRRLFHGAVLFLRWLVPQEVSVDPRWNLSRWAKTWVLALCWL